MSELINILFTPQVQMVLTLIGVIIVFLYLLSILYVIKDARARGSAAWWAWGIVSIVPLAGLVAYLVLRPSSYAPTAMSRSLRLPCASTSCSTTAPAPPAARTSTATSSCAPSATRRCAMSAPTATVRSMPTGRCAPTAGHTSAKAALQGFS